VRLDALSDARQGQVEQLAVEFFFQLAGEVLAGLEGIEQGQDVTVAAAAAGAALAV
jgi:hypothetical protein